MVKCVHPSKRDLKYSYQVSATTVGRHRSLSRLRGAGDLVHLVCFEMINNSTYLPFRHSGPTLPTQVKPNTTDIFWSIDISGLHVFSPSLNTKAKSVNN